METLEFGGLQVAVWGGFRVIHVLWAIDNAVYTTSQERGDTRFVACDILVIRRNNSSLALTLLEPQSRSGDKPVKF